MRGATGTAHGVLRRGAVLLLAACLQLAGAARAEAPAGLPATVLGALERARIDPAHSAFVVAPLDGGDLQLALGAQAPMRPASTMKLLTTIAALDLLGPDFRWRTEVLTSRAPVGGRLDGDLILRGSGDPSLVIERLWLLVERIRGMGVADIRGDLVLDRSAYAPAPEAGPLLDGNALRPYNVAPDALLINFKAVRLDFVPDPRAGLAHVLATPRLDGVQVPAHVPLAAGACGDWKSRLHADFAHPHALRFAGGLAESCGPRTWYVSVLTPDAYALAAFRALWRAAGGRLHGGVRAQAAPADARPLLVHESPPLAEIIRDIDKFSNNVMARQLYLTLGAGAPGDDAETVAAGSAPAAGGAPAEGARPERSALAIRAWLQLNGLEMPELVLENGSGLSRQERISAANLARLLVHGWQSSTMPDLLAALPLAGVDGTMRERPAAARSAYIKTGTLAEVRAVAGYVFAASGRRYAVVAITNDAHAEDAQAAHDAFLQWVWERG